MDYLTATKRDKIDLVPFTFESDCLLKFCHLPTVQTLKLFISKQLPSWHFTQDVLPENCLDEVLLTLLLPASAFASVALAWAWQRRWQGGGFGGRRKTANLYEWMQSPTIFYMYCIYYIYLNISMESCTYIPILCLFSSVCLISYYLWTYSFLL